jgi:hypothetical protein
MHTLFEFHKVWAYVAIVVNGLVGIAVLIAWRVPRLRGRWEWIVTIIAEAMLMLQVLVGAILVISKEYTAPAFHMFYGFIAFLTVGLIYQYRFQMRGRRELVLGLSGLFLMGLGIRAVLQVSS